MEEMQAHEPVPPPYDHVFVGERRSRRAVEMRVTWESGRLAAKPLFEALRECSICPEKQLFLNLYREGEGIFEVDGDALARLREFSLSGTTIVALCRRVQRELARAGVEHLALIHPAARGAIRSRERYRAHVADVLGRRR